MAKKSNNRKYIYIAVVIVILIALLAIASGSGNTAGQAFGPLGYI